MPTHVCIALAISAVVMLLLFAGVGVILGVGGFVMASLVYLFTPLAVAMLVVAFLVVRTR
jgi:hypothetical protein